MILFNTTVHVDLSIERDWLKWAKTVLVPKVQETGLFVSVEIYHLMNEIPEASGNTYTLQCYCESQASLTEYQNNHAEQHLKEMYDTFPNKVVAFQTQLQRM